MKPKQQMEVSEKEKELVEKLRRHPEMSEQLEGLLEEVEDGEDRMQSADEMEEALVKRVREIGRLGMGKWARNKAREAGKQEPEAGARRGGKKNSGG